MIQRFQRALLALLALLTCLHHSVRVAAASSNSSQYITYQQPDGTTVYLENDRRPALYTGNYGDCLGNSLINFTKFDAAYYKDNMTVLFQLEGNTAVQNESLVLYISVFAYGETRLTFLFNPCSANIPSLCPLNSSVPITAQGIIPVSESDVAAVPSLAYAIPDFEGQAVLRVYANSTQTEIGCYSAVLTNGKSFSQVDSVGTVLGLFALITMIASFATAVYGAAVPTMRLHYAHSLSTGVVMAVYQHIFYTGALSLNWPSVLVAWWSNFAWAGGMIYSSSMQTSINKLVGNNIGSTAEVGAAPSDSDQNGVGGTPAISEIYRRGMDLGVEHARRTFERNIARRADPSAPLGGYTWFGQAVGPNLPLPGNYSGFAGTLAEENIPVSNAFMTGFLWFLILLVLVAAAVVAFKWMLELLGVMHLMKKERLRFFRDHWLVYTGLAALRTCYLGWFVLMFLTVFEFTFTSSGGVKGVAAVIFILMLVGIGGAAVYACLYRSSAEERETAHQPVERKKLLGMTVPWPIKKKQPDESAPVTDETQAKTDTDAIQSDEKKSTAPIWTRMVSARSATEPGEQQQQQQQQEDEQQLENIHDDDDYTAKFGWLASRFRRTKWWFFAAWLVYEFVRACFYAGASGSPLAQVFGLLVIEVFAFGFIVWARPFEGRRLNILVVYCLGFSKITSLALSAAFATQFNLDRITTTVIGVVIIVIQGILTIITMIAVLVGAMSSYMSVSRNHEDFRPRRLANTREKYFDHMDRVVNDLPREPKQEPVRPPTPPPEEQEERQPYFEMRGIRRVAKIEDEDEEFAAEMQGQEGNQANAGVNEAATTDEIAPVASSSRSRPASVRSTGANSSNLPFGARKHRPSWSSRDFASADVAGTFGQFDAEEPMPSIPGYSSSKAAGVQHVETDDEFRRRMAQQQPVTHQHTRSRSQGKRLSRSKHGKKDAARQQQRLQRQYSEQDDLPTTSALAAATATAGSAFTASAARPTASSPHPPLPSSAAAMQGQQQQQEEEAMGLSIAAAAAQSRSKQKQRQRSEKPLSQAQQQQQELQSQLQQRKRELQELLLQQQLQTEMQQQQGQAGQQQTSRSAPNSRSQSRHRSQSHGRSKQQQQPQQQQQQPWTTQQGVWTSQQQQGQTSLSRHPSAASSLRVGGEVSTTDTIGPVPAPPAGAFRTRSRASTAGSMKHQQYAMSPVSPISPVISPIGSPVAGPSRRTSFETGASASGTMPRRAVSAEGLSDGGVGAGWDERGRVLLTPAMELDEWVPAMPNRPPGSRSGPDSGSGSGAGSGAIGKAL